MTALMAAATPARLAYNDPTGERAAANVDNERRLLREYKAEHIMSALLDRKSSTASLVYLFRAMGRDWIEP